MSPIVKFVKCVLLLGLLSVFMALNDVCLTSSITAVGTPSTSTCVLLLWLLSVFMALNDVCLTSSTTAPAVPPVLAFCVPSYWQVVKCIHSS